MDSQVVQRVVPPRPGRVSARSVACLFRAGCGAGSDELHALQQGRQPADTDALPTCGGWPGRGLLGLERVRQVGVWCWPPFLKLSQGVSSQSLVPGCRGRAGQRVGGSPGPQPQVRGGIGGGLPKCRLGAEPAGFLGLCSCLRGQRVHSLASRSRGLPAGRAPTQQLGSVSAESAGMDQREVRKLQGRRASFPSPPLRRLRRQPRSCLFPKVLWSKEGCRPCFRLP